MLKRSSYHTNPRSETYAPLINCIIDDALLEMMTDIDQALLQSIDVMNLLDSLLYFSLYFVANRVQICAVWWRKV